MELFNHVICMATETTLRAKSIKRIETENTRSTERNKSHMFFLFCLVFFLNNNEFCAFR